MDDRLDAKDSFGSIGAVQELMDILRDIVNNGDVRGIMFQVMLDDGTCIHSWNTNLSFVQRLGMLESCKIDIVNDINNDEDYQDDDDVQV